MRKLFFIITVICVFVTQLFSQSNNVENRALSFFNVYPGSMGFLNFYMEYASGDLTSLGKNPKAKRNMENLDTKLTYWQTLKKYLGWVLVLFYKQCLTIQVLMILHGKKEVDLVKIVQILFLWWN